MRLEPGATPAAQASACNSDVVAYGSLAVLYNAQHAIATLSHTVQFRFSFGAVR